MLNEVFVVPKVGVEPTRVLPQWILNPSRLPFRHSGFGLLGSRTCEGSVRVAGYLY